MVGIKRWNSAKWDCVKRMEMKKKNDIQVIRKLEGQIRFENNFLMESLRRRQWILVKNKVKNQRQQ